MPLHKLESITSAIPKSEWKSLDRFISTETSASSDLHTLHSIIYRHRSDLPDWSAIDIEIAKNYQHLSTKRILNLRSKLSGMIEDWIIYHESKKNEMHKSVVLIKYYNRNGIFDLADKTYDRLVRLIETNTEEDLYSSRYLLEATHYHFFSENPIKRKKGRILFKRLLECLHTSTGDFCNLYLSEASNFPLLNGPETDHLINKTNILSEQTITPGAPLRITTKIHSMILESEQNVILEEVLADLKAGVVKMASDLQVFATLYGIIMSKRHWHKGTLKNTNIIRDYYDYALSSGVLLQMGVIECSKFLNLVSVLITTQTQQNCIAFIDKWLHLVADEEPEGVEALAHAYVMIQGEKYEEIRPKLLHQKYNHVLNQTRADSFLLMGIYKEGDYELLNHQTHNFRRRIRGAKSKLGTLAYISFLNFAKVLHSLSRRNYTDVTIDLQKMDALANRNWIQKELKSEGINN